MSSFFRKCSKLKLNLENPKKLSKIFFVSEINASEIVAINCLCKEENTCHRESMG